MDKVSQEKNTAPRVECGRRVLELEEDCAHDDGLDQERPTIQCQSSIAHMRRTLLTRSWLPLSTYCPGGRERAASSMLGPASERL